MLSIIIIIIVLVLYPDTRDADERARPANATPAEVDWWDRTRAEYITITITITMLS